MNGLTIDIVFMHNNAPQLISQGVHARKAVAKLLNNFYLFRDDDAISSQYKLFMDIVFDV